MKYYNIYIWGGVEAELRGPYQTEDERVAAALGLWRGDASPDDDSIFRLDVDENGEPSVFEYGAFELEEPDENEDEDVEEVQEQVVIN
ncbi:MAG: hypothetical protein ABSF26_25260 [Thermoguttaceae bacterium]|jgi:hypothetical protein